MKNPQAPTRGGYEFSISQRGLAGPGLQAAHSARFLANGAEQQAAYRKNAKQQAGT